MNAAIAPPTSALTGRRASRVLSSIALATIASPSNVAHTMSTVPHASGVPSLPIAIPTVRVSTQTPIVAALTAMTASTTARDGRRRIAARERDLQPGDAGEEQAVGPRHAGVLAHHGEVDAGGAEHQSGDAPAQHVPKVVAAVPALGREVAPARA